MFNILGEGECAVVYRARWRGMDTVAKMLKSQGMYSDDGKEADARADLMHEISVLSRLRSSNSRIPTPLQTLITALFRLSPSPPPSGSPPNAGGGH